MRAAPAARTLCARLPRLFLSPTPPLTMALDPKSAARDLMQRPGVRIGVAISRFHEDLTGAMLRSAEAELRAAGMEEDGLRVVWVPGAFELPLVARRLAERGVRFIQVYSGGNHNDANWDAHGDLVKNHELHAGNTDKPIAGLLKDLKQRGLLDETLVVWGGEFGRQPTAEYKEGTGRDHNAYGFTMWMAGGGIKGGVSVGATDELGSMAVDDKFHVRRLHATILNQLGLDPNNLSFLLSSSGDCLVFH